MRGDAVPRMRDGGDNQSPGTAGASDSHDLTHPGIIPRSPPNPAAPSDQPHREHDSPDLARSVSPRGGRRPRQAHESPIDRLHALRADSSAGAAKIALIERIMCRPPRRVRRLLGFHDDLLFLRAFPDSRATFDATGRALAAMDTVVRRLGAQRHHADETGVTHTDNHDAYSFVAVEWIEASFPGELDIDWPRVTNDAAIDALLRHGIQRAEDDAFDSGELSTRAWIRLRKGSRRETDLACLLRFAPRRGEARRMFETQYDAAEIPLRWRLDRSAGSVTHLSLPVAHPVLRRSMRRPPVNAARFVASPTRAIRLLPLPEARRIIHASRAALAARGREVFATFNPNPHEVYLGDFGEGASIAVIGLAPERRFSVEANYGYVMFSNGVPIGYGGVTAFNRQANTGLNIFPAFRGSEAAFLWVAALRVFRSLFGVKRFVVNPIQVGEGNKEAIASGAFWFYYRLGFRPADRDTRALAQREFAKMRGRHRHTHPDTLKRLAHGDLHLDLGRVRAAEFFDEQWLVNLGRGASQLLASVDARDPEAAARALADDLARTLGGGRRDRWPAAERAAFLRLAPVCAQIPDLARWPLPARRALVELMRAKGHPQERDFVLATQRHPRFFASLRRVAAVSDDS